ncbi:hypothetical protein BCV70DRAFT_1709 [Testicularia cyperi]|uniref:Uncharacterized protein n=1 Tax=Testicularia cyperi TaxID=1882483 RepID=A0A317XXB4_9BASI|nr:hypothetical protein BCV70DRAFT_1709 [Testicularia cyperi]
MGIVGRRQRRHAVERGLAGGDLGPDLGHFAVEIGNIPTTGSRSVSAPFRVFRILLPTWSHHHIQYIGAALRCNLLRSEPAKMSAKQLEWRACVRAVGRKAYCLFVQAGYEGARHGTVMHLQRERSGGPTEVWWVMLVFSSPSSSCVAWTSASRVELHCAVLICKDGLVE